MDQRSAEGSSPRCWWAASLAWLILTSGAFASELQVGVVSGPLEVDPAGTVTLVLLLHNAGAQGLWLHGEGEFPLGWQLATSLRDLQLPPGVQRAFPVVVRGPAVAAAGPVALRFAFRTSEGEALATLSLLAQVPVRPRLALSLHEAPVVIIDAPPRLEAVVHNLGNVAERVRVTGPTGVLIEPADFSLEPGASRSLRVTGSLPTVNGGAHSVQIELRASGDAGGEAVLRHSLTLLSSQAADAGPWHTLPTVVSLGTRTGLGGATPSRGVSLGLRGGGPLREGSPATLRFLVQYDPHAATSHGWLAWEAPQFGVRLAYGPSPGSEGGATGEGFAVHLRSRPSAATHLEFSWLRSATRSDLSTDLRWQAVLAEGWRSTLRLVAGVRTDSASSAVWRGRAALRLRNDRLDITIDASHTPAPAGELAPESTALRASGHLNLRSPPPLDRAGLELTLRGGVAFAREVSLSSEERVVDLRLGLQSRLALTDHFRVSGELAWDRRNTSDPGSGWSDFEQTWRAAVSGDVDFAGGRLSPTLRFNVDPTADGYREFAARLQWRTPHGRFGDGGVEAQHRVGGDEPERFTLAWEWGLPIAREAGRFAVQPRPRWLEGNPLPVDLPLRGENLLLEELSIVGRMQVGIDAGGAIDWEGGAQVRGRPTRGPLAGVDLRAELQLLNGGWRTALTARGDRDLNDEAQLAWEVHGQLGNRAPASLQVGVRFEQRLDVPIGRRDAGHVAGSVTRSDGTPLAGVGVAVGSRAVATAADGRFHLPNLSAGEHYLTLTAGTVPASLLVIPRGPTRVRVVAGETAEVRLVLVRAASLTGHVLMAPAEAPEGAGLVLVGGGDPSLATRWLAGVSVTLRHPTGIRRAVSDAHGRFHFAELEPGSYHVAVETPRLPPGLRVGTVANSLEVREGAQLTLEIPLEPVVRVVQVVEGGVLKPR